MIRKYKWYCSFRSIEAYIKYFNNCLLKDNDLTLLEVMLRLLITYIFIIEQWKQQVKKILSIFLIIKLLLAQLIISLMELSTGI